MNETKRQLLIALATALMVGVAYICFGAPIEIPPIVRLASFTGGLLCWGAIVTALGG
jgi:xanthosine utilization system XapX-like protein